MPSAWNVVVVVVWLVAQVVGGIAVAASANDNSDLAVAKAWLVALKSNDTLALTKNTALPFTFGTTDAVKKCEGVAKTAAALSWWSKCARRSHDLLISELNAGDDFEIRLDDGVESKRLRDLTRKVAVRGTWVRAYFNGQGVSYSFRFLLVTSPSGFREVAAFLLDADFETG